MDEQQLIDAGWIDSEEVCDESYGLHLESDLTDLEDQVEDRLDDEDMYTV